MTTESGAGGGAPVVLESPVSRIRAAIERMLESVDGGLDRVEAALEASDFQGVALAIGEVLVQAHGIKRMATEEFEYATRKRNG
jgi:hypothetical protein